MVNFKVTNQFWDTFTKKIIKANSVIEVSEAVAEKLTKQNLGYITKNEEVIVLSEPVEKPVKPVEEVIEEPVMENEEVVEEPVEEENKEEEIVEEVQPEIISENEENKGKNKNKNKK